MAVHPRIRLVLRTTCLSLILVFAPAVWYLAPAFDAREACERGADWASAHRWSLPNTVAELAAFPKSLRNPVFTALTPEAKAQVWRQQLALFRSRHSLSSEQRAFVDKAISNATARLYSPDALSRRDKNDADIAQFGRDAKRLFGTDAYQVFYKLGYGVPPQSTFASVRFAIADRLREMAAASAAPLPDCECSLDEDCGIAACSDPGFCQEIYGCGPGGILKCRDLCGPI